MELISPLLLYCAAIDFQKSYALLEAADENFPPTANVVPEDCKIVSGLMAAMYSELLKLNCPVAAESCSQSKLRVIRPCILRESILNKKLTGSFE